MSVLFHQQLTNNTHPPVRAFTLMLSIALTLILLYNSKNCELLVYSIIAVIIALNIVLHGHKKYITLETERLIITYSFMGLSHHKKYWLNQIESMYYQKMVKSDVYTSNVHAEVLGVDVTPEHTKKYYYHPEVIRFYYVNRRVVIGKWKKQFDGEKLVQLIREQVRRFKTE